MSVAKWIDERLPNSASIFGKRSLIRLKLSMYLDDSTRLKHLQDAAQKAIQFVQKTRSDLESNEMLALSLVKCIEILGEAASSVNCRSLRK
ncbi:hypothetical protein [Leptothermofonsia sp. ETS-13]|uniref:hypothetical protein n=1 Tax=Leptothermofonsia sp. ETS-13 TaxID=3035696 RepID=UPI003B9E2E35